MKRTRLTFKVAIVVMLGACVVQAQQRLPENATRCAVENGRCDLPEGSTGTVWYGANGAYRTRSGVGASIPCNNQVFGDPIPGTPKACWIVVRGDERRGDRGDDRYARWGRETMERVNGDLELAFRESRDLSEEDVQRFRRIREHLNEFRRDWENGRFDREALNDSIRGLRGLVERARLQPRHREILAEDANRLQAMSERWEREGDRRDGDRRR